MEPLRGWEPPPWSLTPKADALSQALYLLLLGSLPCALAMAPCKEEEYPVGSECCPKCSPGYRVKEACGELTGTLCVPCDPGTYTAHLNGLSECLQCRVCDPAMGLVTRQKCSRKENTVCVCDQGHFCISEDGDDCAECRPHTPCQPGQRVRARGTEWHDRMCEDCPPGTFSASGALEECQPWSTCSGPFQTQSDPGTSSSDVTCSSWGLYVFVSSLVIVGLCVLTILGMRMKKRQSPGKATAGEARSSGPSSPRHCDSVSVLQGDPPRRHYFTRSCGPHQMSPRWLWRRQRPCPPGGNDPLTDRWLQEADV
ncbi:tumor necrosis factor receptor superfamily member 14 isoform X1 [Neomonachus schauinslandi]|uniref:Tumor necrosis factor receptor superfamily member 14 isoform X1 n=1 Tax=Neomonachus schauinslandi TaxID=29088 RepID=A0A2Y9GNY6_NEOSC|nr:tumor necrosis factor receptor superfamily member 14 isoform X1 [Neomonachus schauinslandi]XP_021539040.1 tumor necrosis factor receptor superfamily member 14 isoform X1 [Neomonachus schauinslandi]